jgi:pimeloyl-ACP methyl ester carboxylesterase
MATEGYIEVPGGRVWYAIEGAGAPGTPLRDMRGRLGVIAVPALVTAGRHDEARPARMRALADELPQAELAIFENSSHLAFVEERAAYIGRLRPFLRAHA